MPLLHICEQADPWFNDHTRVVEQRYKELGGQITVVIREGRHPLNSPDHMRVAELIIGKTK